jgi:hypothetical protein
MWSLLLGSMNGISNIQQGLLYEVMQPYAHLFSPT